jgi:hypothetical protein
MGAPKRFSTLVDLTCKYKTRLARHKHCSLFGLVICDEEKKFLTMAIGQELRVSQLRRGPIPRGHGQPGDNSIRHFPFVLGTVS